MRNIVRHNPSPVSTATTANWHARAACRYEDPELFFPTGTNGFSLMQANEAKTVCARCPVAELCLETALARNERWGVFGGMDENERARYKRSRARRAKADTTA